MANDILNLIKQRRSIRKFEKENVSHDFILKILEAGRYAPSAANNQPWRFYVITKEENIKTIGRYCQIAFLNSFVKKASFLVVIYTNKRHRFVETDCGLSAQNMMLEAFSLGIGSCYVGAFREKTIKSFLKLKDSDRIIGVIAFGYPQEIPSATERLGLETIAKFDFEEKIKTLQKFLFLRNFFKAGLFSILARSLRKKAHKNS
jgi:nitroreductase